MFILMLEDDVMQPVNDPDSTLLQSKNRSLLSYCRHLTEDFMALRKSTNALILMPFDPEHLLLEKNHFSC